jgi:hypothetical protein
VPTIKTIFDNLIPGGILIWTLKLFRRSEKSAARQKQLQELSNEISQTLELQAVHIVWLLANKNERTVVAWKK